MEFANGWRLVLYSAVYDNAKASTREEKRREEKRVVIYGQGQIDSRCCCSATSQPQEGKPLL
jgi:hypothetical protein